MSSSSLRPPGLLEVARSRMRLKHLSRRTEEAYLGWIRRFVRFHDRRHPREMGKAEVEGWLQGVERAWRPRRLPVVLSPGEVAAVLARLEGAPWLVASLLYGSGLRPFEGLRLRVKDVDLDRGE